ncbi:MAG: crotonase/enoyl-CoA hydratase family protein, partial [Myxococcota bacterium]
MSEAAPHLLVEREGPVVIVTLNRPERRNALSAEMLVRMYDAWVMISEDPTVRVGIVTGADGNFCSGADLKAMAAGQQADARWAERMGDEADLAWKALLRHYRPTKPLIAAVEGYAIAGGTEILQAMDIRVAAETATFGIAEVRRGLFPLGGSTVRLRRQIPYTVAAELLLTGRFVPAKEALEIGLIGHLVPEGQALAKAKEIAEQIAENGPLAVQAVLRS